ncbi:MnhB domain-containing protein [Chloroflexota bacterium]
MLASYPFMTGIWSSRILPVLGKVGTPLLFDIGVYLVVLGITLLIIFSLAEEE